MDILSEIIEISNQIVDTLQENGFFEENLFIDPLPLKRALQIRMQRKWEQENEIILSDDEFLEVCNEVNADGIGETIEDLVDKGALNMSVNEDGEILYSTNKDYNFDEEE
jgi:hypothetical protein